MNLFKHIPSDVGVSRKISLCEAIDLKRYDWIVILVKKWSK